MSADAELSPIKRALLEIRELRARLDIAEHAAREPIAIVGLGIRAPGGVRNADSFAELLWSGRDAITPIPANRWSTDAWFDEAQDTPAKMYTKFGGFIDEVDRFDAEFFGISPREAASMDPQQRLVLELAWEALEHAGHAPGSLSGTKTGVYLGIANSDYNRAIFSQTDLIDPYFSQGIAYSVAAGRLSYVLGLQGPSIAIDTACSSSLVAMHLACQALRLRECDMALAGGVNIILSPELNVSFCKAGMMSRDGKCRTFDADAAGYVRGEGGGMLVLRRLSEAVADHDHVLAVIRGSAVNQDGRSNGLTAPNGPAQEAVIRAALQAADVAPAAVSFVETHGTGTPLGDPIEVNALGTVFSEGRRDRLAIGSVKTVVGHLEAAAGVAGVIKTILSLERKEIAPHLNLVTRNPHIEWDALPIDVPVAPTPWHPIDGRRIAGVSSFGFSGTNAHVIIEEAPAAVREPAAMERPLHILALSARDDESRDVLAGAYENVLAHDVRIEDVCFTANAGRDHFASRMSLIADSRDGMRASLASFREGKPASVIVATRAGDERPRVAFLFTGQGAQQAGMGRALYETNAVFRRALDRCAAALDGLLPRPLLEVMFAAGDDASINETKYAQPATFAIEYALATLWRSWGIEPSLVLGHSLGEYAAACVAGVFAVEDAARVVAARGAVTDALPHDGAMASVFAPRDVVMRAIADVGGALTIAAYNGAEQFVISGTKTEVSDALAALSAGGIETKLLRIPHAAHSSLVEPALPAFRKSFDGLAFAHPAIALVSNVTGELAGPGQLGSAEYWLTHMREPVQFAKSMQTLAGQRITHCIEIGPHPVLVGLGAECLPDAHIEWLASLRRDASDWSEMLTTLQRLYGAGADVDWNGFDAPYSRMRIPLPTYPFRRKRHWIDAASSADSSDRRAWPRVVGALDRESSRGPFGLDPATYPRKWEALARIGNAIAAATLRDAGLFVRAGEQHSVDDVLASAHIGATYKHLITRWLNRLRERGDLRAEGAAFVAEKPLHAENLDALWREAEEAFADNRGLFAYVRHCGTLAPAVLTGRESPLETLFPHGSFELARGLYEESSTVRYANDLASSAIAAIVASASPTRTIRILEIGAGTGGTTQAVLRALPDSNIDYTFTDVSEAFLDRARARFAPWPFVHFALFDADASAGQQGFADASFDVIVASNAIHAVRDLRAALAQAKRLLAPGGMLVLIESTAHLAFHDFTTGLIEGWQHFADDLRTDNPLLAPDQWINALTGAGFEEARAWPEQGSPAGALGQHVIVARVAGALSGARSQVQAVSETPRPEAPQPAAAFDATWLDELARATDSEKREQLRELVRSQVMRILRLDTDTLLGANDRLMDAGMDSLMAVQLRNALTRALQLPRPLPSTLMFDHPTIEAIAAFLMARLTNSQVTATESARASAPQRLGAKEVAALSDDEIAALLSKQLGEQ